MLSRIIHERKYFRINQVQKFVGFSEKAIAQ